MLTLFTSISVRRWTLIGIINLALVALLGLFMRLKVILPLPWFDQKHILHAHSHFAFSGWVSHLLMVLIAMVVLNKNAHSVLPKKYQFLISANLFAAYGMLFCFAWQGYGPYSISFSACTVLLSYVYTGMMWRSIAISNLTALCRNWFRAALLFLCFSSLGTYYLAYINSNGNIDPRQQLAAVYFFLHFQYNGWFIFSCLGLMQYWFDQHRLYIPGSKWLFRISVGACLPAFLLSVLWVHLPLWLYVFLVIVMVCVATNWFFWIYCLWRLRYQISLTLVPSTRILLLLVALAASIKIILQAASVIPALSTVAYGFRPIVIGYLHLVLLGVISLFLLAFMTMQKILKLTKYGKWAISLFVVGVLANEILLMLQGVTGMAGNYISNLPLYLTFAAMLMLFALVAFLMTQILSKQRRKEDSTLY